MANQIVKGEGLEPSDGLASAETEETAKIVKENQSDGLVSGETEEAVHKRKALKRKRRSCKCGKVKRDTLAYCLGPNCPYDWVHLSCVGIKVLPDPFYCCDKCRDEDLAAAKYNEEIEKQEKALETVALVDYEYCTCKKQLGGEMVGCDRKNCDIGWYHCECVGLTKIPKGKWVCPNCKAKKKKKPIVQIENTRTQSSNTPQGSSNGGLQDAAEATNNEVDTGDDLPLVPYLAQVPNEEIEKQEMALETVALVDYEYCTCKKQRGGEMVGCDRKNCDIGWYHCECVGLTKIPKGKWVCPNCKAKKKKKPIVQIENTRTQSSNTPQGSSTGGQQDTAEATNNEGDTGDDLLLVPYVAQVPKEKRNNLIFPIGLVKVLNEDFDLVNRQLKLPKIPARYTLDDILEKFLESQYGRNFPDLEDIRDDIVNLVIFFNKVINLRLLYHLEFVQHLASLNKKRRDFNLSDLEADDFLDQEEFNGGLESLMNEESKENEDMAFKSPEQVKPNETAKSESDERQLRETLNEKSTSEQPPQNVVAKPKKKGKVEQAGSKNFESGEEFNFVDTYGFIHLVRFFYFYISLLKNDTAGVYTKYAKLVNEIVQFLSLNACTYFKIEEVYEIETPAYQGQ